MAKLDDLLGVGEEVDDENDELELEDDDLDEEDVDDEDEAPKSKPLGPKGEETLRKLRKENRELLRKVKAAEKATPVPAKETNEDELRTQIRAELAKEIGLDTAREAAVNVLNELGYRGNAERGARSLELSDVLDDNGKVDKSALRDAVEDWREDEPKLFRQVRRTDVDDDEDEDEEPRRRRPATDMGRKPRKVKATNPLEDALSGLVGSTQLHL